MTNSPEPSLSPSARNQPVHELRLGAIKAAVWQNQTESGVRYNVTFERLYNQDGKWHSTPSFGRDDLLVLAKVADQVHTWIIAPVAKENADPAVRTSDRDLAGRSMPKRSSQVGQ